LAKTTSKSAAIKEVSQKIENVKTFCKINKLPYADKIVDGAFDAAVYTFKMSNPKSWKLFETKLQKKATITDMDADSRRNVKVTFSTGVKTVSEKDIPVKLYKLWTKTLQVDPTDYIF